MAGAAEDLRRMVRLGASAVVRAVKALSRIVQSGAVRAPARLHEAPAEINTRSVIGLSLEIVLCHHPSCRPRKAAFTGRVRYSG
jgi:hypothetical protein